MEVRNDSSATDLELAGSRSTRLQEIGHAVRSVIQGARDSFGYEYMTRSGKTPRWWLRLSSIRSSGPMVERS